MLRACTVNVGRMRGRSREVVDMLARRQVDDCCVQEVQYKGGGATTIGSGEEKFKFWYSGCMAGGAAWVFSLDTSWQGVLWRLRDLVIG